MRQSRTKILHVRVNKDELKEIEKRAKKAKRNISEYVRESALK